IFHGELAAFKADLLKDVGGFPTDIGADDSHTATKIAIKGYRAIMVDEMVCLEAVPNKGYSRWRIRRAQQLIHHFLKTCTMDGKALGVFREIVFAETFLHVVNPWVVVLSISLLLATVSYGSTVSLAILVVGITLLAFLPYRTWMAMQLYLLTATIRTLFRKELVWMKQKKNVL
ncbi:MAG: glycosyltransferase family 2 protein, partial [Candidatus Bathyarchaeia archaeon]